MSQVGKMNRLQRGIPRGHLVRSRRKPWLLGRITWHLQRWCFICRGAFILDTQLSMPHNWSEEGCLTYMWCCITSSSLQTTAFGLEPWAGFRPVGWRTVSRLVTDYRMGQGSLLYLLVQMATDKTVLYLEIWVQSSCPHTLSQACTCSSGHRYGDQLMLLPFCLDKVPLLIRCIFLLLQVIFLLTGGPHLAMLRGNFDRNYLWQCLGDHIGYWCSNLGRTHANALPLSYNSSCLLRCFAFRESIRLSHMCWYENSLGMLQPDLLPYTHSRVSPPI